MFKTKTKKSGKKKVVQVDLRTMDTDLKGVGPKKMSVDFEVSNQEPQNNGNFTKQGDVKGGDERMKNKAEQGLSSEISSSLSKVSSRQTSHFSNREKKHKTDLDKKVIGDKELPKLVDSNKKTSLRMPGGSFKGQFNKKESFDFLKKENVGEDGLNSGLNSTKTGTDHPFLHKTITSNKKEAKKTEKKDSHSKEPFSIDKKGKKKKEWAPMVVVIVFVLFLAGLLAGGYTFYMSKAVTKRAEIKKKEEQKKNLAKKTNSGNSSTVDSSNEKKVDNKVTTKNNTQGANPFDVNKFITTDSTFLVDLVNFVANLKKSGMATEGGLTNGLFVTPMIDENTPFVAETLLKAVGLDELVDVNLLKNPCKLFVLDDNGSVRITLLFELKADVGDYQKFKASIVAKENLLPAKMLPLFVDGDKPTLSGDSIVFNVNKENKEARYFNYVSGVSDKSVDWNVINLGRGEILYFATSKMSAKKITDYFLSRVSK